MMAAARHQKNAWEAASIAKEAAAEPLGVMMAGYFAAQGRVMMDRLQNRLESGIRQFDPPSSSDFEDAYLLLTNEFFSEDRWFDVLDDDLRAVLTHILGEGWEWGSLIMDQSITAFNAGTASAAVLAATTDKIADINGHSRRLVNDIINRGLIEGIGTDVIARRLMAEFDQWTTVRAKRIALTEATAAFEAGSLDRQRDGGMVARMWISARLATTRPAHFEADGQERGIDEPFTVMGESLMHPGDPAGSAANIINCYCTTLPILPKERMLVDTSHMTEREIGYVRMAERDRDIRLAYPAMKAEMGASEARHRLAERHFVSESSIKRIITGR